MERFGDEGWGAEDEFLRIKFRRDELTLGCVAF